MAQGNQIDVFVIMPFGNQNEYRDGNKEANFVFKRIIKPGIAKALDGEDSFLITREVDKNAPGSITTGILKALARAEVVVVDLTGRNPNVFLELGVRFVLRTKVTILIAQEGTIPPFDVADLRIIFYRAVEPEVAQKQLAAAIREGLSARRISDSPVFNTFPQISVVVPGYCESRGNEEVPGRNVMPWPEYWKRIEAIVALLEGPATNGQFTPDAILGISNGGLVAADLIGRVLFRGRPTLSLWANRFSKPPGGESDSSWYFDHEYNNALTTIIRSSVGDRQALLLLLDDHLGTGTTVSQAVGYLKARFDGKVDILFIPLFSNRPEYIGVVEDYLPYKFQDGRVFRGITRDSFLESIKTQAGQFPYFKEISGGA